MKVNSQQVHDIISSAKSKFTDQPCRMHWETSLGIKELTFEEKRFVAMIEATNMILQLGLEIEHDSLLRKKIR